VLVARSPRYPALFDIESGVRFRSGRARVSEAQARKLAERRFVDGILIGELDDEGRIVNEQPAKKWAGKQASPDVTSENAGGVEPPVTPEQGRRTRKPRSN
jgi:hypothetical protein